MNPDYSLPRFLNLLRIAHHGLIKNHNGFFEEWWDLIPPYETKTNTVTYSTGTHWQRGDNKSVRPASHALRRPWREHS